MRAAPGALAAGLTAEPIRGPKDQQGHESRPTDEPRRIETVSAFPLVRVRDVPEILEQDWLIENLFYRTPDGSVGYIFGPPKGRKSLLLAEAALSVALGDPMMGRFKVRHRGTVCGFFAEDGKGETARRMKRLARARGAEVPEHVYLIDTPSLDLGEPSQQERLTATLTRIPDLLFAWFDPMVRLHSVNDNRAEELAPIHSFLRVLAKACPSTVFAYAHHVNKTTGDARGSGDFTAIGDWNIFCRKADENTTNVFELQNRGGPPGLPFAYTVKDGHSEDGPTMQIVAEEMEVSRADRDTAIEEAIVSFRAMQPSASGREGLDHLRTLGLKISSQQFWNLWKGART